METELYILDLLGTTTFASYGAYLALKQKYDVFGVSLVACIAALGGGTIRETIIGDAPEYFADYSYILAVIAGILLTLLVYKQYEHYTKFILFLDSLGLVVFAFVGAARADQLGFGVAGIVFAAVTTAVGGGIIRDVIFSVEPEVMHRGFYASVALLLGIGYFATQELMEQPFPASAFIFFFLVIRLWALRLNVELWKPKED